MRVASRKKVIYAGRLVTGVLYTMIYPRDSDHVRQEKIRISSAARQRLNQKWAWQKLETLLATNFTAQDYHLVLTYRDNDLPGTRAAAIGRCKRFLVALRKERVAAGGELRYIYTTEGVHGDHRLHHHLVINRMGEADLEQLRRLWRWGSIHLERIDLWGYTELAKYLTKEYAPESRRVGERSWVPSLNLKKPIIENDIVPDNETLQVPPGCIALETETRSNSFGSFTYVKYLLPAEVRQKPIRARTRRRQKNTDVLFI